VLEEGVVDLSVDLSRCPFVDSVGVSLLLTTLETLEHAGGRLRVVGATGRTRMVLQTAGVHDVLTRGR
jgi:anti-anti-sigma factor